MIFSNLVNLMLCAIFIVKADLGILGAALTQVCNCVCVRLIVD